MSARTRNMINRAAVRLTLAAVLVAALLLVGMRHEGHASADQATVEAVFGNVVAVTVPDSITVATDSGVVRLVFDSDTTLTGQGIGSLDDVAEGDRVIATATRLSDDSFLAARVLIQPVLSKPVTKHIFGVIVESDSGEVVIQDSDGNVVTVDVTSGIEVPSVGEVVTVVVSLDRTTGRLEAQAFQKASDTIARLDNAAQSADNATDRARLDAEAADARAKHLSVLEQARVALEQAKAALAAAQGDVSKAEEQLTEVQAQYDRIKAQYDAWAAENDRPAPSLRLNGVLTYTDDQWSQDQGVFVLAQRNSDSTAAGGVEFQFTADTQVSFVAASGTTTAASDEGDAGAVDATNRGNYRYSNPVPLSDVRETIDSGTPVIVVYNPDVRPLTALQIIVLPRELDANVSDAIAAEGLRAFQGTITLVEQNVDIDNAIGVVIIADNAGVDKVAAIVTPDTAITLDGKPAKVSDLASGYMVNVVFEAIPVDATTSSSTATRRSLRAASIDARSHEDNGNEVGIVGLIRTISGLDRTITVVTRDGPIKLTVPENASITIDGAAGGFGLLRVGYLVLDGSRYNSQTDEVTTLIAAVPAELKVHGTIVGLSVDPARVVISNDSGTVLTLALTDSTQLRNPAGETIERSALAVGQSVEQGAYEITQGDSGTYLVAKLLVIVQPRVTTAAGVVREVDPGSGVLVINVTRSASGVAESLKLLATDQSVIYKNGVQVKDLASIEVRDIVNSVAYRPSTNEIVKLAASSPNLALTKGTVTSVASTSVAIRSDNGRFIKLSVSSSTKLTLNGRQLDDLGAIKVGDRVTRATYIGEPGNLTAGSALAIVFARRDTSISSTGNGGSASTVEVTLTGVIDGYEAGAWITLAGRKLNITDETRFEGVSPKVGLVARAAVRVEPDGTFTVTVITVVASSPDNSDTGSTVTPTPGAGDSSTEDAIFTIEGTVTQLGQLSFVVNGTRIRFTRATKFDGVLEVDSTVRVIARKDAAGVVVAIEVVVEKAPASGSSIDANPTVSAFSAE